MNKGIFAGNWKQLSGEVQKQWGKLTKDHLAQINGNREKLAGIIQEEYGMAREEAEDEVKSWEKAQKKSKAA